MFLLKDKRALVTGASGGLGRAIAKIFCDLGAKVALSGRRQEALHQLASELGDYAVVVPCDLADHQAASQLADHASTALGGSIEILVNNAGLTRDNLAVRMAEEDWQLPIDVNLTSSFILARSVLRPMMKNRWGRIISISSVVGFTGNPGQANYAASKAGMIGMSKALANEVASRGITVNCLAPGFIETPMTSTLGDAQQKELADMIPMKRLGNSRDVAYGAAFLSSDEASYITGQTLHINGGMAMI